MQHRAQYGTLYLVDQSHTLFTLLLIGLQCGITHLSPLFLLLLGDFGTEAVISAKCSSPFLLLLGDFGEAAIFPRLLEIGSSSFLLLVGTFWEAAVFSRLLTIDSPSAPSDAFSSLRLDWRSNFFGDRPTEICWLNLKQLFKATQIGKDEDKQTGLIRREDSEMG